MNDEAYIILEAAADTTGNAMTIGTYNVVVNPDIYKKLTAELREQFPGPDAELGFAVLEKLPYLVGLYHLGYNKIEYVDMTRRHRQVWLRKLSG